MRRYPPRWTVLTSASTALTLLAACGATWHLYGAAQLGAAEPRSAEGRVIVAESPSLPDDPLQNGCSTDGTRLTCAFANMTQRAVTTCTRGVLRRKDGAGGELRSVVLCAGDLAPNETRTLVAPWIGSAGQLCSVRTLWGSSLDWDQCVFTTEPVDAPTVHRPRPASRSRRSSAPA